MTRIAKVDARADRPDVELLGSMAGGDLPAFESLYRRHGSLAYGLALRMTGDAGRAEDVVQSAFMTLWHARAESDAGGDAVPRRLLQLVARGSIASIRQQRRSPRGCKPPGLAAAARI